MKPEEDSLGNRMKSYENKYNLTHNIPIILRIDGRAFHTLTRGMNKPYDRDFIIMMDKIGLALCKEIQNCRMAYLQSDEISFLILNKPDSDVWFDNEVQKMCSVSSSIASSVASKHISKFLPHKLEMNISFDSRVFIIPRGDVVNYFIWRQKDWERNSLQMFARQYYSQKELEGKNQLDIHDMLCEIDLNWHNVFTYLKRGRCIIKEEHEVFIQNNYFMGLVKRNIWKVDYEIPIFTDDRDYILDRIQ